MTREEKEENKKQRRKKGEQIRRDFRKNALEIIAKALRKEGAKYHKVLAALVEAGECNHYPDNVRDSQGADASRYSIFTPRKESYQRHRRNVATPPHIPR